MTSDPLGLCVVDKPSGMSSHGVVARCRKLFSTRKVGHAGTLDPMATGVLLVGVGRATRLLGHLSGTDKEYLATVRLGQSTVTDDAEGDLVASVDASAVTDEQIRAAAATFCGTIEQVPSAVSAIKVGGVRSYARVRAGEDVELKARTVRLDVVEVGQIRHEGDVVDFDLRVVCSSGTYIRAIARDLGAMLGVGGHLTALRRTRVGGFTLDEAVRLDEIDPRLALTDINDVARRTFVPFVVDDETARLVKHGRRLTDTELPVSESVVAVFSAQGEFLALYEQRSTEAVPVAVFVTA